MLFYACLLLAISSTYAESDSLPERPIFYPENSVITELFSTNEEIRNLVVPVNGFTGETLRDPNVHPPIYMNLYRDDKSTGQYVLLNKTIHRIGDGVDSTADYPYNDTDEATLDKHIYIANVDGIYSYDPNIQQLNKYGNVTEDILFIAKLRGEDELYILAADHRIYKVTQGGTVKTLVDTVDYAKDFTIDFEKGIYYVDQENQLRYLEAGTTESYVYRQSNIYVESIIVTRPLWTPEYYGVHCVPYIINNIYEYYAKGNFTWPNFQMSAVPGLTGFNNELGFINYFAANGKIYQQTVPQKRKQSN